MGSKASELQRSILFMPPFSALDKLHQTGYADFSFGFTKPFDEDCAKPRQNSVNPGLHLFRMSMSGSGRERDA